MATQFDCTFENHVMTVTVISDDGRQILNKRAYEAITSALQDAAGDSDTRVVVLRGLAGCFCLGGDLSEFLDHDKHEGLIHAVTALFRTLATFPKPIVALVDGEAVGVGCTILFHCDLVLASTRSSFRVPFVDFGLVPDAATSILAPARLGYTAAFRFFCLGDTLDAAAALAAGLIGETVDSPELDLRGMELARRLARKPVTSLTQTRSLLRGDGRQLCERVDEEISLFRDALNDETTLRRLKRIALRAA